MLQTKDIEKLKKEALKILFPLKSADENTKAEKNFLFTAQRSNSSYRLPPYYLVYFLFAELLDFKNLGRFEKVAWSFPLDYEGRAFLVEFRKFGIGIFIQSKDDEPVAKLIASKIIGAVKKVQPYYSYIAEQAIHTGKLNVKNNNRDLYDRYNYLRLLYDKQESLYQKNQDIVKTKQHFDKDGKFLSSTSSMVGFKYLRQANWLAISCIDAFYSWTEHLFIHLAIVAHQLSDGPKIADLIEAEWKEKFVKAIPINDKEIKKMYDELLVVRQQLRNFVAHGAFGKNGNAFSFHSKTGAVPVLLNHEKLQNRFSLMGYLSFDEKSVMGLIDEFIKYLWKSSLQPAMYYTQELELPTILTYAKNGRYRAGMENFDLMKQFSEELMYNLDNSANMDW